MRVDIVELLFYEAQGFLDRRIIRTTLPQCGHPRDGRVLGSHGRRDGGGEQFRVALDASKGVIRINLEKDVDRFFD